MLFNALAWVQRAGTSRRVATRLRSFFGSIDRHRGTTGAALVFQHVQLRSVYRYLVDAASAWSARTGAGVGFTGSRPRSSLYIGQGPAM